MTMTMTMSALMFPGQGSQTAEMRELVAERRPDLLEAAIEIMGTDPFERIDEGTRFAQPAMLCASLAGWDRAGRPEADVIAGHSLGELAALVAGGSIDELDGLRLAVRRGALMQEAAELGPHGGMMALLGDDEGVHALAARSGVLVANDNAPGQLVVSGSDEALEETIALAKDAGVRTMKLPVQGAFHSPAMEPVVPEFRSELDVVEFAEPRVPVFSSISSSPFTDIREQLASALTRPVNWRQTMVAIRDLGVERFLEAGPGKVLTNLVRRTLDGVESATLEKAAAGNA